LPALLILLSGVEAKAPEKKPLGIGRWFLFLLVGFGVMYIGAIIGNTVMDYFSELMGYDYSNALEDIVDENHIWITAIFTVIVAPIGEEFVFRKLLMDRTQKYGGAVSVLISAIVFGLMHGNFYQFFYCLGLGLILAYIYHSTGRLLPCILLHASINLVGSVVPTLLSPVLDAIENIDLENVDATAQFLAANVGGILAALAFSLFVYASMAAAVIIPIVMRKKIKLGAPEVAIPRKRAIAIIVANAGAIVLLALYALEFGLSLIPA
jgi:membrane protease YdiL (CAAX protease family)